MLALLHSNRRLTGGQDFHQAPLLAQSFLDFWQALQCLEDPRQVETSATSALFGSLCICRAHSLEHFFSSV
jgi:hypothetical protein